MQTYLAGNHQNPNHNIRSETNNTHNSPTRNEKYDPLYEEAKKAVIEANEASVSLLQRELRLPYNRAAKLIDLLEKRGVIYKVDSDNDDLDEEDEDMSRNDNEINRFSPPYQRSSNEGLERSVGGLERKIRELKRRGELESRARELEKKLDAMERLQQPYMYATEDEERKIRNTLGLRRDEIITVDLYNQWRCHEETKLWNKLKADGTFDYTSPEPKLGFFGTLLGVAGGLLGFDGDQRLADAAKGIESMENGSREGMKRAADEARDRVDRVRENIMWERYMGNDLHGSYAINR